MKNLVYLACPYNHPDPSVRESRFQAATLCAGRLMQRGIFIFSPLSHTHPIALAGGLPLGWDYWHDYDTAILSVCKEMLVLAIDGWRESKGVAAEIALALEMGIPVSFVDIEGVVSITP